MAGFSVEAGKTGIRDLIFLAVIGGVILVLVLGSRERTTADVPEDAMHQHATSRASCVDCHEKSTKAPFPKNHNSESQCFLCHKQPRGWRGGS